MSTATAPISGGQRKGLAGLQKLGRSLMLPIAALPAAGLLLRLGQDDLLGKNGLGWTKIAPVIGAAGGALLDNLPLLFAVGVAIGWAKKSDGSTALAAVVGYLVFGGVSKAMSLLVLTQPADPTAKPNLIDYGVLGGVVSGIVAAVLWQRCHRTKLPDFLGFFGGRRLVPILTGITEPLEFSLMFIAWPLYVIHAVLTGTSLALCNWLGIRDGFTFSAGLFDYVLNYGKAEHPILLLPIGLGYAVVYYVLFRLVIRRWNLRTPGRGDEDDATAGGLVDTGR